MKDWVMSDMDQKQKDALIRMMIYVKGELLRYNFHDLAEKFDEMVAEIEQDTGPRARDQH